MSAEPVEGCLGRRDSVSDGCVTTDLPILATEELYRVTQGLVARRAWRLTLD